MQKYSKRIPDWLFKLKYETHLFQFIDAESARANIALSLKTFFGQLNNLRKEG